jgi:hypothetical protein
MDKIFKYTLLKYRPSSVLDEQVNIGVLFLFAEDNRVVFVFPDSLTRLSSLYPDADLRDIKTYLTDFRTRAIKLSDKKLSIDTNLENWTEKAFLIADANSFFFSDFKVGVYSSVEATVDHFRKQYLAYYDKRKKRQLKKKLVAA